MSLIKTKGVISVQKKDTESSLRLSDGDILGKLRRESSIYEFLPEA